MLEGQQRFSRNFFNLLLKSMIYWFDDRHKALSTIQKFALEMRFGTDVYFENLDICGRAQMSTLTD